MKKKNRYCLKRKEYCKFANRCAYCTYYEGYNLCSHKLYNGKANDYTFCHGKTQKCFECDMMNLLDEHHAMNYCNEAIKNTN